MARPLESPFGSLRRGTAIARGIRGKNYRTNGEKFVWDSVPQCKVVRYSLEQTVVGHSPEGPNGCQNCQIFTTWVHNWSASPETIKRKRTTPKGMNLKPVLIHVCHAGAMSVKKEFVAVPNSKASAELKNSGKQRSRTCGGTKWRNTE
jgi:hypothetical protein